LQAFDLQPQFENIAFALRALAPFANIAAKSLNLDQQVIVAAVAAALRRRLSVIVVAAAIADVVFQPDDCVTQGVDRIEQTRFRRLRWRARSARRWRIAGIRRRGGGTVAARRAG